MKKAVLAAALAGSFGTGPAHAGPIVSCGGAVALGAAQLACSHVQPGAPPQFCTFSWALFSDKGSERVVEGSFAIPPGASNLQAYQGAGFSRALSSPIVLCRKQ